MPDTTFLFRWIDEHDARCPRCRYQLRGVRSKRCPECGEDLVLQRCDEFDWWAAGVFGLAFVCVADVILLLLVLLLSVSSGRAGAWLLAVYLAAAIVGTAGALMMHLRRRERVTSGRPLRGIVLGMLAVTFAAMLLGLCASMVVIF